MISPLRAARGGVALAVFVLALEGWARLDDHLTYGAPLTGPYNAEILYTRETLGRVGKPHARYRKWGLNEAGFRGPELEPDRLTILAFGASETFGLYEDEGQEYPRQLEHFLNARIGRDAVQVVNAAYPGESAYTADVRAPEIVDRLHARVAIVYPTPADYIWLPFLKPKPAREGAAKVAEPFEWRIADRLRTFLKGILPQRVQTRLRARETRIAESGFTVMDRLPEENVRRFRDDVAHLVQTLKARGVAPVIVTHANLFGNGGQERDRAQLVAWRKFYPMLREEGFADMERRMNDALRAVAAEERVPLIDVAASMPGGHQNFADFVHFTNRGATLMAQQLANGLYPVVENVMRGPRQ